MKDNLHHALECTSLSLIDNLKTAADIFFIHIDGKFDLHKIESLVKDFNYRSNLKLIMTSGFMSEDIHDMFDSIFENASSASDLILTVWSNDNIEEGFWEFINVHGDQLNINSAHTLVIADSVSEQMKVLARIAATGLSD